MSKFLGRTSSFFDAFEESHKWTTVRNNGAFHLQVKSHNMSEESLASIETLLTNWYLKSATNRQCYSKGGFFYIIVSKIMINKVLSPSVFSQTAS